MSGLDARIENLMSYAESRSAGDRTILFRNLIDLFLTQRAPSKQPVRRQLLDVLTSLLPAVETDTRQTAIDLIAGMSRPPADLVKALAQDEAPLVEGLLRAAVLEEDDLLDIIAVTSKAHHQIIASRADLSANVWIALARAAPGAATRNPPPRQSLDEAAIVQANSAVEGLKFAAATATSQAPRDRDGFAQIPDNVTPIGRSPKLQEVVGADEGDTAEDITERNLATAADNNLDGWSFKSDRDGFVIALSPNGSALFSEKSGVKGAPLLDFLGLNAKLGHPIARAFQRRSPIHNAPLYLGKLPKGRRYWTLSASPQFGDGSGKFMGYMGSLVPAVTRPDGTLVDTNSVSEEPGLANSTEPEPIIADGARTARRTHSEQVAPLRMNAQPPATAGDLAITYQSGEPISEESERLVDLLSDGAEFKISKSLKSLDEAHANPAATSRSGFSESSRSEDEDTIIPSTGHVEDEWHDEVMSPADDSAPVSAAKLSKSTQPLYSQPVVARGNEKSSLSQQTESFSARNSDHVAGGVDQGKRPIRSINDAPAPSPLNEMMSREVFSRVESEVRLAVEAAMTDKASAKNQAEKSSAQPVLASALVQDALDSLMRSLTALKADEAGEKQANRALQWTIAESAIKALQDSLAKGE